jgi:hypothetical protein
MNQSGIELRDLDLNDGSGTSVFGSTNEITIAVTCLTRAGIVMVSVAGSNMNSAAHYGNWVLDKLEYLK